MTINRINDITFNQLSSFFASSIYNVNNNASKTFKMVLIDSNDNYDDNESKIIDLSSEWNPLNVLYLPITLGNNIKFTVGTSFNGNSKTYTISNIIETSGNLTSFQISSNDTSLISPTTINGNNQTYGDIKFSIFGGAGIEPYIQESGGGGAGSDPYITTIYGEVYELPKLTKWWNIFSDEKVSIKAHTQNYTTGNYFNEVVIHYLTQKVIIDFNKRKIINKSKSNFEESDIINIGKVNYGFKFKNKDLGVREEKTEPIDCIQIKDSEYKEILILINWEHHYIIPKFYQIPNKKMAGLITKNPLEFHKNQKIKK
jgi:hypothetical protein